jgi:hypothetical protein
MTNLANIGKKKAVNPNMQSIYTTGVDQFPGSAGFELGSLHDPSPKPDLTPPPLRKIGFVNFPPLTEAFEKTLKNSGGPFDGSPASCNDKPSPCAKIAQGFNNCRSDDGKIHCLNVTGIRLMEREQYMNERRKLYEKNFANLMQNENKVAFENAKKKHKKLSDAFKVNIEKSKDREVHGVFTNYPEVESNYKKILEAWLEQINENEKKIDKKTLEMAAVVAPVPYPKDTVVAPAPPTPSLGDKRETGKRDVSSEFSYTSAPPQTFPNRTSPNPWGSLGGGGKRTRKKRKKNNKKGKKKQTIKKK